MHQFARSRPISELWPPPTAPINTVSGFSRLGVIKGRCLSKHVRSTSNRRGRPLDRSFVDDGPLGV